MLKATQEVASEGIESERASSIQWAALTESNLNGPEYEPMDAKTREKEDRMAKRVAKIAKAWLTACWVDKDIAIQMTQFWRGPKDAPLPSTFRLSYPYIKKD